MPAAAHADQRRMTKRPEGKGMRKSIIEQAEEVVQVNRVIDGVLERLNWLFTSKGLAPMFTPEEMAEIAGAPCE